MSRIEKNGPNVVPNGITAEMHELTRAADVKVCLSSSSSFSSALMVSLSEVTIKVSLEPVSEMAVDCPRKVPMTEAHLNLARPK